MTTNEAGLGTGKIRRLGPFVETFILKHVTTH